MIFQITQVKYDFEDNDFELPPVMQEHIIEQTYAREWEVDSEENLKEELFSFFGFAVKEVTAVKLSF